MVSYNKQYELSIFKINDDNTANSYVIQYHILKVIS